MRRPGTFSFFVSLGIHGMLVGAVLLCIGEKRSTPPRIHLVYGEVGSEDAGRSIAASGEERPPAVEVQPMAPSNNSTDALDAQSMGDSAGALWGGSNSLVIPVLLTADGAGGAVFGSGSAEATPKFHFSASGFPSAGSQATEGSSSGRTGTEAGTDVASIPQPIYPKESRRLGEQGKVLLEVEVKADGSIGEIKILQHPGHERLVLAAIDAIKRARIDPATEDGRPIASTVRVPFNFVLR